MIAHIVIDVKASDILSAEQMLTDVAELLSLASSIDISQSHISVETVDDRNIRQDRIVQGVDSYGPVAAAMRLRSANGGRAADA